MTTQPVSQTSAVYTLQPIGKVRRSLDGFYVVIDERYHPALRGLGHFSHVIVLWWADQHDNPCSRAMLQTRPPYASGHTMGVFATRAEYRPNPIAVTTCKLIAVDEVSGILQLRNIDALDETPVLDLKAYFPVCDRVREAHIPEWILDWPEWMPDEGLDL